MKTKHVLILVLAWAFLCTMTSCTTFAPIFDEYEPTYKECYGVRYDGRLKKIPCE